MVLFYSCILIFLLLYIYISKEHFYYYEKCLGKRDGVSGCRTCCSQNYTNNYSKCVNKCMN